MLSATVQRSIDRLERRIALFATFVAVDPEGRYLARSIHGGECIVCSQDPAMVQRWSAGTSCRLSRIGYAHLKSEAVRHGFGLLEVYSDGSFDVTAPEAVK